MKKWQKVLLLTATHILAAMVALAVGFVVFLNSTSGMNKLRQIYMLIDKRYVGQVDEQHMFDMAAAGMVAGTGDRWSYYISADEMADYVEHQENAYVGIGVTIEPLADGSGVEILRLEPNGPALENGMCPGDVIVKVDGTAVSEIGTEALSSRIAGKEGTKVTITVLRDGQEVEFTLTRKLITRVVAEGRMLEGNIGYVRIDNFNSHCASQTIAQIESLVDQGAQGLIFDVRFNGGGYVTELVELLDYLLPQGDLFVSQQYNGKREVETSDARCLELPMAVLVNAESYSAAEFFPAALREYEWAQIVGTPTVGKGNFQQTFPLADGSAVALSTGRYYTPKGVNLQDVGGLTPDVVVEVDQETENAIYAQTLPLEEDPQVQAALQLFIQ